MDDNGGGGGDDDDDDDAIPDIVKLSRIGWYWKYYDETLLNKYYSAASNLEKLKALGASVFHEVDAATMMAHPALKKSKFDRIVFNFPHAGFNGREDSKQAIRLHQNVLDGFFHNSARMLSEDGEVPITHKRAYPYDLWEIEQLASERSLVLKGRVSSCRYRRNILRRGIWIQHLSVGTEKTLLISSTEAASFPLM